MHYKLLLQQIQILRKMFIYLTCDKHVMKILMIFSAKQEMFHN